MASHSDGNMSRDQQPIAPRKVILQGGYDCTFVEKLENLQTECSVCLCVLRDPHLVACCGYRFCQTCVDRVKETKKPCPLCNSKLTTVVPDKQLQRQLNSFRVYCSNKDEGCDWIGELREFEQHLNADVKCESENRLKGCKFTSLACEHCNKKFQRQKVIEHEKDDCELRPFSCDYCNDYSSTYQDVVMNHWPVCECRPVPCSNECGVYPERKNLKHHIDEECPRTIIHCDFDYAGCKVKLPRENMPQHVAENLASHISMLAITCKKQLIVNNELCDKNKALCDENKALRADLDQSNLRIDYLENELQQTAQTIMSVESMLLRSKLPIVLVMDSLTQHTTSRDQWFSPPFYSHDRGYKMCLGAIANNSEAQQILVLFFQVYVLCGEFDDELKWPLKATVTVKVLDQSEETKSFEYTVNVRNACRVFTEEGHAYSPSGNPWFNRELHANF